MFRDECTRDKFKLNHHTPDDFTRCFWQKRPQIPIFWVVYRGILCAYFDFAILLIFIFPEEGCVWYKNGIYFTFWSYVVEMIAFTLAFGLTVEKFLQERKTAVVSPEPSTRDRPDSREAAEQNLKDLPPQAPPNPKNRAPPTPKGRVSPTPKARLSPTPKARGSPIIREIPDTREYPNSHERPNSWENQTDVLTMKYKVLWVIYTIAAASAAVVTTIFFLFAYTQEVTAILIYTLVAHVSNTLFITADFFLCAIPIRFLHFYIPVIFGMAYVLFTGIYQGSGGTGDKGQIPIYSMLDWRYPKIAIMTIAVQLTCTILLHCGFCILGLLKQWLKMVKDAEPQTRPLF